MSKQDKIGHRQAFTYIWGLFTLLLKNWSVVVSVGGTFLFFGSTITTLVLVPIGQKTILPIIRGPVKDIVITQGKPIVKKIDSVHFEKLDFLQNQIDSLKIEVRK